MAEPLIKLCAGPFCSKPLPAAKRASGRPREYCSDACRIAAHRLRHVKGYDAPGPVPVQSDPGDPVEAIAVGRLAPVDEQVARAVMEARDLTAVFRKLGRLARPRLKWRCQKLAEVLASSVDELFGGD